MSSIFFSFFVFFFKQKTAYEIKECDWSSDVCSSDLKKAVDATNAANTLYQIRINETDFTNNGYGIYFSGVNDAVVVGNNFELGIFDDCQYDAGEGIYLDNCKRFAIEDNSFSLPENAPPATYVGIHTANTNNAFDEIYKNHFDDMIEANYAEGKNWLDKKEKGLAYYCNTNQNNSWDFYVEKDNSGDDGIQLNQGNRDYVAGNTFSPTATEHFDNRGSYKINYYFDLNATGQTPTKVYRVDPIPEQLSNTCPDHYDGGDTRMNASDYQQREADYNAALSSYNTAKAQYEAANDSVAKQLYGEQMSYYNMLLSRAMYDMVHSDLSDTVTRSGLFEEHMDDLGNYAAAESVVDLYMQKGDYATAIDKLDSLQVDFVFDNYDSVEYPYYHNLKTMQATWLDQGRTIFDLTASEINSLSAIADSSRGVAGAQARGILAFAYDSIYSYVNCLQAPDSSQKSIKVNPGLNSGKNGLSISVKPNPARNTVTFTYTLPENVSNGLLKLYYSKGMLIEKHIVNKVNSEFQYNCSLLPAGVYYYSFSTATEKVTGKMVIIR